MGKGGHNVHRKNCENYEHYTKSLCIIDLSTLEGLVRVHFMFGALIGSFICTVQSKAVRTVVLFSSNVKQIRTKDTGTDFMRNIMLWLLFTGG